MHFKGSRGMAKNKIKGLTIELNGETKNLSDALNSVTRESKDLQSELSKVEKLLKLNPDNIDLVAQRQDILAEATKEAKKKVDLLHESLEQLSKQEGVDPGVFRQLQREAASAEIEFERLINKQKNAESTLAGYRREVHRTSEEFKTFKETAQGIEKITKGFFGVIAAGAAGLAGAAESTREYREDLARLEMNAETAGAGIDSTKEALKSLNAISSETDSNVEALSNILKAGFTDNNLQSAVEALSGAVIQFPDTLKIEGLADGLQETLATGAAVGPFAELLERLGMDLNEFNSGLLQAKAAGEEQQYILNLLASTGLADVAQGYRDANADLLEYKNAQFELNDAISQIGAQVEPILTELIMAVSELISWVLDNKDVLIVAITAIGTALLALNVAMIIQDVSNALKGLETATILVTNAQKLLNSAMLKNPIFLIITLIATLVTALITLWNTNEEFRSAVIGIWEGLKAMLSYIIDGIVTFFTETIPNALQTTAEWFASIPQNIANALITAAEKISQWGEDIWTWITGTLSNLIKSIVTFFTSIPEKIGDIGGNIMEGIKNGILNKINVLKDAVKSVVEKIKEWFTGKNGFDTHSPSKWGETLGYNIDKGVEVGLTGGIASLTDAAAQVGDSLKQSISDASIAVEGANFYNLPERAAYAVGREDTYSPIKKGEGDTSNDFVSLVSDAVGTAMLAGFEAVANAIFEALPKDVILKIGAKEVARAIWSALDKEGRSKNRMFAPSREEIMRIVRAASGSL